MAETSSTAEAHACAVCLGRFASKNKLFRHLSESRCCGALASQPDEHAPKSKKARRVCGRIQVSVAQHDRDVEPDDCLLPEKLRLIKLAGIETEHPICICGCEEPGGGASIIPRDVLRALRVMAMSETELYFAGGPTPKDWAASECTGMSIRNEIRALNHLRKLIRANDASHKAKRQCRQGLLKEVDKTLADIFNAHLPAEAPTLVTDPLERLACERFESWCRDVGISTKLSIKDFPGLGRGMAATEDLSAGEVVINTPTSVFLNTERLEESRFAHVFAGVKGLDERASHILLVLMEFAALQTSKWQAYLEACPLAFDNALTLRYSVYLLC